MYRSSFQRVVASLFAVSLVLSLVPATAFAAGSTDASATGSKQASESGKAEQTQEQDLSDVKPKVTYRVDTTGKGWNKSVKNKKVAGKADWSSTIERIRIKAVGPYEGGVKYRVRTVKGEWTDWSKDFAVAGKNKKGIEAIQVKLTGKLAKHYNIYYRAYSADWHWLGWAKNGQKAGTGTHKYPIAALRIKLVEKGDAAPGTSKRHYTEKKVKGAGLEWCMNQKAQKQSSPTKWLIMVNRQSCWVGVFKGKKGAWKMKKFFRCSCGRKGHRTPKGTYHIGQRFTPLNGKYTEYWAIRVTGAIHFHSILHYRGTHIVANATLGKHISLGCIRCATKNAKWMYDKLPDDTTCHIYGAAS